jgi:hypothetical protein
MVRRSVFLPLLVSILSVLPPLCAQILSTSTNQTPIQLSVDAREATRGILHATMTIPVQPGPMTLLYPKWVPGNHAPTGPISELAGLRAMGGGREIRWNRDPIDMYAFHLEIPTDVNSLDLSLDYLIPQGAAG